MTNHLAKDRARTWCGMRKADAVTSTRAVSTCVECMAQQDYHRASPMAGAILGVEFYREKARENLAFRVSNGLVRS